ncbi:MAG TPA: hypothetical protein VE991_02410, partial [Acidimicrobiales bacterium]|nr:hypothetical protein [Acidimicrobiales bacterium]
PSSAATPLVGVFTIAAGSSSGGAASGSYFRMILQGGNASGPFLSNSDSTCSDQSYTLMSPGTDGGLVSGSYQPQPSPAFDASGNSLASRVIAPDNFYGVRYGVSTQPTDPQTGSSVPAPQITVSGTSLGGNLSAVSVSWNKQYFNQGVPKPDGSMPGDTTAVTGTYDPSTGAYTMQWTSLIVGGPFNGFSGLWHLTGRFVPAGSRAPASSGSTGTTHSAPAGSAGSTASATGAPATPAAGAGAGAASATASGGTTQTTAGSPATASTRHAASTLRVSTRSGLDPPRWLVVLIALLGVAALAALVYFERRIRLARAPGGPR